MVKVKYSPPVLESGEIDIGGWAGQLAQTHAFIDVHKLKALGDRLANAELNFSLELAELLADLKMDQAAIEAGLIYRMLRSGQISTAGLGAWVEDETKELALSVLRMASASLLEMSNSNLQDSEQESQVENVKRMLVAMIDDPRVAVVKLAERVIAIRHAKHYSVARRQRLATEAFSVFAPLAGRLGIGQLKWELEDFALRYTQEDTYKTIARQLSSKRTDREEQIVGIEERLRLILQNQGIDGIVHGRAKHIYSIWRKMQVKGVAFDQVYDVRAFRVIVTTLAECYAVLGLIHTTWSYLPSEFDDYIANPKENGYQSIHTAVTLENGQMVEVQIRTQVMHDEAELGVCAHWNYKGERDQDAIGQASNVKEKGFSQKTDWLRQVIEWHEELGGVERLSTLLQHRASDDRIYVSTPHGHVLDLPTGATVLDFAYRVHTDVGNKCERATIDGINAPLHHRLATSQQVSIITGEAVLPKRDWLEQAFQYVSSDRARAKLVSYFRSLDLQEKVAVGRTYLSPALEVLGAWPGQQIEQQVIVDTGSTSLEDLLERLGGGEISLFETVDAFIMRSAFRQQLALPGVEGSDEFQMLRLNIKAVDREGLLHEITEVLSSLSLALMETTGRVLDQAPLDSGEKTALISIGTHVRHWHDTLNLHSKLRQIEGVRSVGLSPED
ncbi:MAG: GTP pyrophosphokinase [Limisphaerales bacterium]|jgi:GTP pyrophosphokinase